MDWAQLVTLVIAVIGIIFGATFFAKWKQLVNFFTQLSEAANKTADILADQKITKQEALSGLKEWLDVWYTGLAILPANIVSKIWKRFTY